MGLVRTNSLFYINKYIYIYIYIFILWNIRDFSNLFLLEETIKKIPQSTTTKVRSFCSCNLVM